MAKSERSKKSKVLTSVAAVVLAASMLIGGGTYAYLQGESDDVINEFNANQVTVDLKETTGNSYEIIPGTTQEKDPKVTVNATVPAYVFVTVEDETDGLVDYAIADGWTKLDGYDNVYYREVAASHTAQEFDVLAGNTVSYDAALANSDMVDEDGNLKDGLALSFKAYAIQKDPFADAVQAWESKDDQFVGNESEFFTALENGGNVTVVSDIELDYSNVTGDPEGSVPMVMITKDTALDLNGKTIIPDASTTTSSIPTTPVIMSIMSGTTVIDGNGTISAEAGMNNSFGINVNGGNLIINGGNYYGAMTAIQVQKGTLTINGGFFDLAPTIKELAPSYSTYLVNCIDENYKNGTATVEISGGTFVNYDPSKSPEQGSPSFLADGYTVESEVQANGDTWYTVVKAD